MLSWYLASVIFKPFAFFAPRPMRLSKSWVELNSGGVLSGAENEYIRLLREAQRESRDSSVRHSRASSIKGR
ncbi:jg13477 [Pararge aegeria aegeria]|uniref:Jg13477 protein n=1 Tax=Pararge aegeria aegeria TaxID=348720 RepID=A0A8S4RIX9_9NEOP|nr:jg13477 [Pararge aegeria aegeria]